MSCVVLPSHQKIAQTDQFSCEILHSLRLVLIHLNFQISYMNINIYPGGIDIGPGLYSVGTSFEIRVL